MDLQSGDAPAGPQELQIAGLDVEEVEEVAGRVQQRVLVQHVQVVAAGAVVAQAVAESERGGTEVTSDVRAVVHTDLSLLRGGGLRESLQHPPVHHMQAP